MPPREGAIIRPVRGLPRDVLLPAVAGLLLGAAALVLPPRPHGDAVEYLLVLASVYRHGAPELQPQYVASLSQVFLDA